MTKAYLLICKNNNRLIFFRISRNFWNIKHFFRIPNSFRVFLPHLIQKNSFQNRWNWYAVSCCEKNKIISGKLLWLKSPSVKTSISIFYWTLWCVQSFFALTQWGQKYYYVKFSYPYIFTNLYSIKDWNFNNYYLAQPIPKLQIFIFIVFFLQNFFFDQVQSRF